MTWLGLIEPGNPPQSLGNDHPDTRAHGLLGVSSVPFKASKLWLTCLCLLPPLISRELHRPNHDTPLLRVVPRCPIAEHKVLFVLLTPPLASFPTFFTKSPLRQPKQMLCCPRPHHWASHGSTPAWRLLCHHLNQAPPLTTWPQESPPLPPTPTPRTHPRACTYPKVLAEFPVHH